MKIVFNPPELGIAPQAASLRKLAEEIAPEGFIGELRVVHPDRDKPLRLVLIQSGRWPTSIRLPPTWLYEEHSEYELRDWIAEFFHAVRKPGKGVEAQEGILDTSALGVGLVSHGSFR